jgi:hypothetical protein
MKNILLIICSIILFSCGKKNEIPKNSIIVSKFRVFDENISPKLNVCPNDTIRNFTECKGEDCMFKLDKYIFEVDYKISLTEEGHMKKFQSHSVTEEIDFKKFGITNDTINLHGLNGNDILIKFSKSRNEIIDGDKILEIVKVFPIEKLIFVKEDKKNGRRIIYEYN